MISNQLIPSCVVASGGSRDQLMNVVVVGRRVGHRVHHRPSTARRVCWGLKSVPSCISFILEIFHEKRSPFDGNWQFSHYCSKLQRNTTMKTRNALLAALLIGLVGMPAWAGPNGELVGWGNNTYGQTDVPAGKEDGHIFAMRATSQTNQAEHYEN